MVEKSLEPGMARTENHFALSLLSSNNHSYFVFQNDDNFLNIIYEAYLFSVRKAAMKKSV